MLYQRMHAYQPEGEPFDSMFRRCAARIRKNPPDMQYLLALLSTIDNQNEIFAKGYKRPRAFQPGAVNDQQIHNNDGFFNDLPLAKQSKKKQGIRFSQKLSKEAELA